MNQIGLNSRVGAENIWHDAAGSLFDKASKQILGRESDFTEWNPLPTELDLELKKLFDVVKVNPGRVRLMRLAPKTGLSVHADAEFRYHLVVKTNKHAMIGHWNNNSVMMANSVVGNVYHIPADGYWYKVDTRKSHWVYNGGFEERIHIVVCAL